MKMSVVVWANANTRLVPMHAAMPTRIRTDSFPRKLVRPIKNGMRAIPMEASKVRVMTKCA